ncbi:uncharacterized protein LOC107776212 isoform X1 [Nicotiana tabacum]|uniref:Mediator of RNA polymerase II transcription subunit 15a-like n=3 Tax=Nicotiana tabacum TaxID=4097 RepID=A0A1S3YHR1_TOBAC|nr:PREDICTED: uncharacterized protein LOC107776212 [Nicotiana tabacum]
MDSADWRTQLLPDSRQRIVNNITETLKRQLSVTREEGVQELKKIAVGFEEKIYTAAISQPDYLQKISLKMLTMETKSHNPMTNLSNAASSGQNAHDPGTARAGAAAGVMDAADWRTQLLPDFRQSIVNKITETLMRHLPVTGEEGVQELKKIALRFEEKIYTAAISQPDYLRKISLKMLTMETDSQNPMTNSANAASSGQNAHDPGTAPAGAAAGDMDAVDWRTQLLPDSRQRIVNKITETLKRHLPVTGEEGVQELKKIALRFEEKIYTAAISQPDYLRKISLKMLTMETKSQHPMTNSINAASSGQNALGPDIDSCQEREITQGSMKRKREDWGDNVEEHNDQILPTFTCEICTEVVPITKKFNNFHSCNHSFCSKCIERHVEVKIQLRIADIQCPYVDCGKLLDPLVCRTMIPLSIFEKWCDLLCKQAHLGFEKCYCPYQDCGELIVKECGDVVGKSECPNCRRLICFQCGLPWNVCEENGCSKVNDTLFKELVEQKQWTKCPSCNMYVERIAGCNHMQCRCNFSFCYKCGKSPTAQRRWCRCK